MDYAPGNSRRCLLNVSTGQCIRMHLPELRGHDVLGPTTEGLLVLLDRSSYVVRLLNPLTGQVTDLPPATTLLRHLSGTGMASTSRLREKFEVSAAGLADDSTFAVYFCRFHILAVAKPGDECWMLVDQGNQLSPAISFEGCFYCTTTRDVMVVETSANQPPRLVPAAKLTKEFSRMLQTVHLVDNGEELILVYPTIRPPPLCQYGKEEEEYFIEFEYNAYLVDLKTMNTKPILALGGRAIFISSRSVLSVSPSVFPSIKSDSIYIRLHDMLGTSFGSIRLDCLMDGTTEHCGILEHGDSEEDSGSGMPQFGPWGIDDDLSWYVTDSRKNW